MSKQKQTRRPSQGKTWKGWAFNKPVPYGLNNMPCVPFFRRRYMADESIKDWMAMRGLKIVRATLALSPHRQGRGGGRKKI